MNPIVKQIAAAAIVLLAGSAPSEAGPHPKKDHGRPSDPPGQERKTVSVPEPATLSLIALGVGGGLLVRYRRSRKPR